MSAQPTPFTQAQSNAIDWKNLILSVSVLYDIDVSCTEHGVSVPGLHTCLITWGELALAVANNNSVEDQRERVYEQIRLHSLVMSLGENANAALRTHARLMALPISHALIPGPDWAKESVPGDVLVRGIGISGALDDPETVLPLPAGLARRAGLAIDDWWPAISAHAEDMASLMMTRLRRDRMKDPKARTLRPIGGVDVLGLISTNRLRRLLVAEDGSGMRTVCIPSRTRGWLDHNRIDNAYVEIAQGEDKAGNQGLSRPIFISNTSVTLPQTRPSNQEILTDRIIDLRDSPQDRKPS